MSQKTFEAYRSASTILFVAAILLLLAVLYWIHWTLCALGGVVLLAFFSYCFNEMAQEEKKKIKPSENPGPKAE